MTIILEMTRGDSAYFDVTVTRGINPEPLTDAVLWFTAKKRSTDSDEDAIITKDTNDGITITDAANGQCRVNIIPSDTASIVAAMLLWDIQMQDSNDDIHTIASGTLRIVADITQRVTV